MPPAFTPVVVQARSAIPRAVGILAIIFAVIGMAGSVVFTWGALHDLRRGGAARELQLVVSWLYAWGLISVVLFVVHLAGGILACSYRPLGLRLLTGYAVGALVLIAVDLVLLGTALPAQIPGAYFGRSEILMPRVAFAALAAPWPVIVVVLVNLRRARDACTA